MRSTLVLAAGLSFLTTKSQWTDPGFGTNGIVNTALDAGYDGAYAMVQQPDGKLVITGPSGTVGDLQVLVARYGTDGALDESFGTNGVRTYDIGDDDYAYAIALQPDGKILVAGTTKSGSNTDILVMRLHADGTPDNAFDGDGIRSLDLSTTNDKANAIAVRPNGHIVIAGNALDAGRECWLLAELKADGNPEPGFGSNGIVKTLVGEDDAQANAMALLADGTCVVAGSAKLNGSYDFAVCRFLSSGALDPSFGSGGRALITLTEDNDRGLALVVQPDGGVLIGGVEGETGGQATIAMAKLDADGQIDALFGTDGITSLFHGNSPTRAEDIALQPDGGILLCGTASPALTQRDAYVCRLHPDGTLDADFGDNGELRFGAPDLYRETPTMVLQPDGKVVIGGVDAVGGTVNALLIRYFGEAHTGISSLAPEAGLRIITADAQGITIVPPAHALRGTLIDGAGRTEATWSEAQLSASPCVLTFHQPLASGMHTLMIAEQGGTRSARSVVIVPR